MPQLVSWDLGAGGDLGVPGGGGLCATVQGWQAVPQAPDSAQAPAAQGWE